ncbi:MAG TPA: DEAD/DEAH box helicase [Burkholderiales bacterium]|nr:DEAD/DEAH box helicase [Burkholderiales bacterium]
MLRAVAEQGYTQPTPIQSQGIPVVLAGRDLLAAAQTGTGKTAGFTLPMLQLLGQKPLDHQKPRALVLVPTRELAAQVEEAVRTYGKHVDPRTALICGGVGFTPQVEELRRGADIVVATPGRLLDHSGEGTIDLSKVEILVLDEADRMLDMGFIHDIRRVLALLPAKRQNLLFSATFPDEVRKLAAGFMHDPVTVEVAPRNTPVELIDQIAHPVNQDRKRALLAHLVKSGNWQQVLVFTRTKHGANRLAEQLERDGIQTAAIHGNKSQPQRMKALQRFKDCELQVLVATDIAARGIDIESLPHVVNYDLPHVPEDYVHRIGRTGRAGESGQAVSLVSGEDRGYFRDIERLIGRKIEQQVVPGFEPGSSYHSAQPPQPQQQRAGGQRGNGQQRNPPRHNGQRRPDNRNNAPRGPRPQGAVPAQGQRRDRGRGQGRPQGGGLTAMPSELTQQALYQEQLEHHRRQQAEEQEQERAQAQSQPQPSQQSQQPQQPRQEPARSQRAPEPARKVPALFAPIGRKGG